MLALTASAAPKVPPDKQQHRGWGVKQFVRHCSVVVVCVCCLAVLHARQARARNFEKPQPVRAADYLPQNLMKGQYHEVDPSAANDGYLNIYTIKSSYGTFRAASTPLAVTRIGEINAMVQMDQLDSSEEFGKYLAAGGRSVVHGAKNLVQDPVGTLENAFTGVGKLFERAGEGLFGSKSSKYEDSTLQKVSGFSNTKRDYAQFYGVDPYSTNQTLQDKLDQIAQAGYAGNLTSMALKAITPGAMGVAVSSVSSVNWLDQVDLTLPPTELRLKNKELLAQTGVPQDVSAAFMDNDEFTPTQQSLLVKALSTMEGVGGRDLFLRLATTTRNQDEALFRQRMAIMYAAYHKKVQPIEGFVQLGQLVGAQTKNGTLVLCFPLDHLIWTQSAAHLAEQAQGDVATAKPATREMWLTGDLSKTAANALQGAGWKIHARCGKQLLGEAF